LNFFGKTAFYPVKAIKILYIMPVNNLVIGYSPFDNGVEPIDATTVK
jgi:hypothetical protein